MMTVEGNLDAAGGPIGMFPDRPWTPEAGFEVERPPAQLDDPVARTLANLAAQRARADGVRATEANDPA
ncbi:MAG: hypothetical protein L0G22_13120 [Propionibacteriaceae bacterium]|nr:hypothetical protein [Propionibacteriaceae bacterium]